MPDKAVFPVIIPSKKNVNTLRIEKANAVKEIVKYRFIIQILPYQKFFVKKNKSILKTYKLKKYLILSYKISFVKNDFFFPFLLINSILSLQ